MGLRSDTHRCRALVSGYMEWRVSLPLRRPLLLFTLRSGHEEEVLGGSAF